MNVLAVIPARGGSKGVPCKNLRRIGGRSLVAWAVAAARESQLVNRIVCSSDDPMILVEAEAHGAEPLSRPAELATETASTDAVLLHALDVLAGWEPELVVLLQPTVPLREPGLVDHCVRHLLASGADAVLTAHALHFVWRRRPRFRHNGEPVPGGGIWIQDNVRGFGRPRRQDFAPEDLRWHEDGAVFVTRAETLRRTGSRVAGIVELVPHQRSVDVDTEDDLVVAEALLHQRLCSP